jgi:hypothetical protein
MWFHQQEANGIGKVVACGVCRRACGGIPSNHPTGFLQQSWWFSPGFRQEFLQENRQKSGRMVSNHILKMKSDIFLFLRLHKQKHLNK